LSAQLSHCTIVEQFAVIQFLWSEGLKSSEIHIIMLAQCGENCVTQRKMYKWAEVFRSVRTSDIDDDHLDRPTTS